ncbi:histidine phosphatase family protein [Microbacterium oxydans]|uniref:histidine phosphatase family protein n=1 Tax=Microbacterium oxydans TaxID=82380 RepID=UPI00226B9E2D|nr:histidine phosphatase family protein [Microbacterium oxydans]WAA66213.1 histidine phosphatase family protein [Microbacterium oxydans]
MPFSTPPLQIALVRHGETDWNARNLFQGRVDRPLSPVGRHQARGVGSELAAVREWDRLVASPLVRARQTAEAIGDATGLSVEESIDDLIEQSFGAAEGVDREEAMVRWPDRNYPGGEPLPAVKVRAYRAWDRIVLQRRSTIVVSHVVVIRALVEAVTGSDPGFVGNGSATVLTAFGDGWALTGTTSPGLVP